MRTVQQLDGSGCKFFPKFSCSYWNTWQKARDLHLFDMCSHFLILHKSQRWYLYMFRLIVQVKVKLVHATCLCQRGQLVDNRIIWLAVAEPRNKSQLRRTASSPIVSVSPRDAAAILPTQEVKGTAGAPFSSLSWPVLDTWPQFLANYC
jgi:hypothetical protein